MTEETKATEYQARVRARTELGDNAEVFITHAPPSGTLAITDGKPEEAIIGALKDSGFRWSRSIQKWYLPRTRDRSQSDRDLDWRVSRIEAAGATVGTRICNVHDTAELREERRQERANDRAARAAERAVVAKKKAEEAEARTYDMPVGGEPIKIGHHSQRQHERAIERSARSMRRAVETMQAAHVAEGRARTAARNAGPENPEKTWNRIEKLSKEIKSIERMKYDCQIGDQEVSELDRLTGDLALERGRRLQQIAEGRAFSICNVRTGDLISGKYGTGVVEKVNRKTLVVKDGDGDRFTLSEGQITRHTPACASSSNKLEETK